MATHSSIFAWKIPWKEELCWLQSMGLQNQTKLSTHTYKHKQFSFGISTYLSRTLTPSVLVCQGCHNKVPQNEQCKQQKLTFSHFQKLQVPDEGIGGLLLLLLSRFSHVQLCATPQMGAHCLWDSPSKNTGVGCHFLLQCVKVKSKSEVTQSCRLLDPGNCSVRSKPNQTKPILFEKGIANGSKINVVTILSWVLASYSHTPAWLTGPAISVQSHSCHGHSTSLAAAIV